MFPKLSQKLAFDLLAKKSHLKSEMCKRKDKFLFISQKKRGEVDVFLSARRKD
jgi:hypothetical protein